MFQRVLTGALLVSAAVVISACASKVAPVGESKDQLIRESEQAVSLFKRSDSSMERFFDRSYGYAIFPKISKGAAGVGGANGRGLVYEQGDLIGYTTMSQATIGLQLGGQSFSEIIFFRDKVDLTIFKQGNLEFDANASAVAATSGAGASADYSKGVAVFTMARGGLMFEASIGGQNFTYAAFGDYEP